MKLLVLSNMYPSEDHVFFGIYVKNFIDRVIGSGITVDAIVIRGRGNGRLDKIGKYIKYTYSSLKKIIQGDYNSIYIHSAGLALIPITLALPIIKKPIIINAHGTDLLDQKPFSRLIRIINLYAIKKASLLVLPSQYYSTQVDKQITSCTKVYISPSGGINRDIFKKTISKQSKKNTIQFGFVSRIDPGKGWDVLLLALSKLHSLAPQIDFNVSIIGTGQEVKEMLKAIQEMGLDKVVTYLGPVPHESLPTFYNNIDAFIFPTQLCESLGLVGLEAMSCGTPVIASKIGGINDYLKDGENGLFFRPGDADDLYRKLLDFLSLKEEEKLSLSRNAILTAKQYDASIVSKNLEWKIQEIYTTSMK